MSKKQQQLNSQRRGFLRGSLVVATGVALSTGTGKSMADVSGKVAATEAGKNEGYRLTQHIKDYYKSAAI